MANFQKRIYECKCLTYQLAFLHSSPAVVLLHLILCATCCPPRRSGSPADPLEGSLCIDAPASEIEKVWRHFIINFQPKPKSIYLEAVANNILRSMGVVSRKDSREFFLQLLCREREHITDCQQIKRSINAFLRSCTKVSFS